MSHFASYSKKKKHTLILEHWSKVLSTHVCLKNAQRWAIQSPKTWCAKNASKARLLSLHWNCLKRFKVGNTASGLLTILLHFKLKATLYPPGKFRTFNRVLIVPLLKLICLMYILKLWFLRNVMIVIIIKGAYSKLASVFFLHLFCYRYLLWVWNRQPDCWDQFGFAAWPKRRPKDQKRQ